MTQKKVGRNDPCPCGSGKKYKNCHMLQEKETAKTYTPSGKRKFTAKVISTSGKSQSVFQRASSNGGEPFSNEDLKFKLTSHDFRKKSSEGDDVQYRLQETKAPDSQEPISAPPLGEFKETKKDFREEGT